MSDIYDITNYANDENDTDDDDSSHSVNIDNGAKSFVTANIYTVSDQSIDMVTKKTRVVFRDWDEWIRYSDLNAIYSASNYNKDVAMVVFLEAMRNKEKYETYRLWITGWQGERGMCQAMPFWFASFPERFNDDLLTNLDKQVSGCLRLRDRAWRGDNLVGTFPLTYPARMKALEYIDFVN